MSLYAISMWDLYVGCETAADFKQAYNKVKSDYDRGIITLVEKIEALRELHKMMRRIISLRKVGYFNAN